MRAHGTVRAKSRMSNALSTVENTSPSFWKLSWAAARARRALQKLGAHDVWVLLTVAAIADTLHAVTMCSRALATAADLKGSASFMTVNKLAPHARIGAAQRHRQSIRACLCDESG